MYDRTHGESFLLGDREQPGGSRGFPSEPGPAPGDDPDPRADGRRNLNTNDFADCLRAIRREAVLWGDFTLSSGQKSPYYIDLRRLTLDGRHLACACRLLLERASLLIELEYLDALGGPSLGADPLVAGCLIQLQTQGIDTAGFLVRSQGKEHGTGNRMEGLLRRGMLALILEDVVTTGASSVRVIEQIREVGAIPVGVVCLLDRLQGGEKKIEEAGVSFRRVYTTEHLNLPVLA